MISKSKQTGLPGRSGVSLENEVVGGKNWEIIDDTRPIVMMMETRRRLLAFTRYSVGTWSILPIMNQPRPIMGLVWAWKPC